MKRPPIIRTWSDSIICDNFAGGGGASSGIEAAFGRSPDIAINHDPEAIAMHRANHPDTRHFVENVWQVDPVKACDSPHITEIAAKVLRETLTQRCSTCGGTGFIDAIDNYGHPYQGCARCVVSIAARTERVR